MATACNKELRNCGNRIDEGCERSELQLTRMTTGEIEALTVAFGSTSVSFILPSDQATTTCSSSTTMQDLPNEILDYILMKAVVKKVLEKKLAKSAWIDYASRVIQPMRTVWSRWNYNLTTNWFRIVLSRNLNKKNAARISVAKIDVIPHDEDLWFGRGFAKLGNQMYLFRCHRESDTCDDDFDYCCLMVFEDKDLSRSTKSIPLPLKQLPMGTAACSRSNSIYLYGNGSNVFHMIPDGNDGFDVQRWPDYSPPSDLLEHPDAIGNFYLICNFSVLDDGNLLVKRWVVAKEDFNRPYCSSEKEDEYILSVQKPDGLVIRNTKFPRYPGASDVVMKSNGNFVYAVLCDDVVIEVDQDGNEIHSFHWITMGVYIYRLFLDSYDRVMLLDSNYDLTFLDDELNFVEKIYVGVPEGCLECGCVLLSEYFYRETNEIVLAFLDGFLLFVKLTLE